MTAPGTSGLVALVALAVLAAVAIGLRLGALAPLTGFLIFMPVWIGGGATALALGLLALRGDGPRPWLGIAIGALLLLAALPLLRGLGSPRIHDITTDPADAPAYTEAARLAAARGRDLTYPHGGDDVPALQRAGYADLHPVILPIPTPEALALAERTAGELGWDVVWRSPVDPTTGEATFEATATSALFRFVDDVVVRVRAEGTGSRVDVRSTSRVGRGDLGANAARVRAFVEQMESEGGR